ncbi:MAG: IS200/IS605 family transposase [SAR324 cluster bacterium]|nr:IS200/IS605 family transposase [SAR324 cluster bacterium]
MSSYQSLSHMKWECKYHVVFIRKCRRRKIYGSIRNFLGEVFHQLAHQKGCQIMEGHLMSDHVRMCISIPPKYAISNIVGFIKGKCAISIACEYRGKKQRSVPGESLGTRGYFVSTVCLDEETIR